MRLLNIQLKKNEIVMLSVTILCLFFLFYVTWEKIGPAGAMIDLEQRSAVAKRKLADNKALFEKLNNRAPASVGFSSEYMDRYVLNNDRFSGAINGIVTSSKAKDFVLKKIQLEEQSVENGYKKLLYILQADATFIEVGKFLEKIEEAPLLTEVNSVEITRDENEMRRCHAEIKLYSYVRPDEKL